MKTKIFFPFFSVFFLIPAPAGLSARAEMNIAATSTTLASVVREITGERAEVYPAASPKRNIHFYEPTPKDVLKVKNADAFVHEGLDLELWRDPLLQAAGNAKFFGRSKYSIDASKGIPLLEVPALISRAEGDIHVYGNPHYWMDPENMSIVASTVGEGLAAAFPDRGDEFLRNAAEFKRRLDGKTREWKRRMKPFEGTAVVTYHRSWTYFTERFGFQIVGEIEPKPGIPPTARHISSLVRTMREKKARLILKETFFEKRTPDKIAGETGAQVVVLAQAVGEVGSAKDYISMIEHNIRTIEEALRAD